MASKYRSFTFALTIDDTPNIEYVLETVVKYPKYAYILHNSDVLDDGTPKKNHYHFYVEFPNPRSFQSIANDLDIATNFIEKVYDKASILLYLTHKNRPDKFQYDDSDIISNFDVSREIKSGNTASTSDMFRDFQLLRQGMMTASTFIEKYDAECSRMNFYNKLRTIDMVTRADACLHVPLSSDPFAKE